MKNNISFIIFFPIFFFFWGGVWKVKKKVHYVNKALGVEGGDGHVSVVYSTSLVVG